MSTYNPYSDKIEEYQIGDNKTLKIGIIGDSQLIDESTYSEFYRKFQENFKKSLEILKEQKINVLIIDGDIVNVGYELGYDNYLKQFNSVYGNEKKENVPILNLVMGNHDYWLKGGRPATVPTEIEEKQKLFEEKTKEKPFSHKVINGYHFINWSCENGTLEEPITNNEWFEKEIEKALENNKTKPIFVTTHFPPKNTVYGSQEWGDERLNKYFKKYPQIINISGHSHYSLIDERSIYQKDYTAIQTQSLSYIELESGKVNGTIPRDEYNNEMISTNNSMGLICKVDDKKVVIKRISFEKNKFYGNDWIIDVPIDKNNFKYIHEEMEKKSNIPKFVFDNENDKKVIFNNYTKTITFKQAFHPNFVHSYKIILRGEDGNKYINLYFSDFFLMPEDRKKFITLCLNQYYLGGKYNIKIYAIESFGKESENYIEDIIVV